MDRDGNEQREGGRERRPPGYLRDYVTGHATRPRHETPHSRQQPHPESFEDGSGSSPGKEEDNHSVASRGSRASGRSVTSELRRRQRQVELNARMQLMGIEEELERKQLEMEKKQLERKKEVVELQKEMDLEDIRDEEEDFFNAPEDDLSLPTPPIPPVTPRLVHPASQTQQWVNQAPSQPASLNNTPKGSVSTPSPAPSSAAASKAKSEAVQIGEAIALAIGKGLEGISLKPKSSDFSEKMLARQSHGKDLPEFNGRPEQWLTFLSSFQRSTDVCGFQNEDNVLRLRKCLKGEAMAHVEILLSNPDNVPTIIKRLETRFGQKCHIIQALVTKAQEVPKVKENDFESVIQFGKHVLNLVEVLKAFKSEAHLANPQLLHDLSHKLPPSMQIQWKEQTSGSEEPNLLDFADWIGKKVDIVCQLVPPPNVSSAKGGRDKKCAVLATEAKEGEKPKVKKCLFCDTPGHNLQACRQFQQKSPDFRYKYAKEKRLCFGCLNFGHGLNQIGETPGCRSKKKCREEGCDSFHHHLLHKTREQRNQEPTAPPAPPLEQISHVGNRISYQVIPVILRSPKGEVKTHALLDGGSGHTLLDQDLAAQLRLEGKEEMLYYSTIDPDRPGEKTKSVPSQIVELDIVNPATNKVFRMMNVNTFPNVRLSGGTITKNQIRKWKHLCELPLPVFTDVKPKMLIGLPHAKLITMQKVVTGPGNAPVAAETPLGWTVFGRMAPPNEAIRVQSINQVGEAESDCLHQLVKSFFTTEEFGVKTPVLPPLTKDQKRADDIAKGTLRRVGERFEIGLLWKEDDVSLPESRATAVRRLRSVEHKLDRDPVYAQKYCNNVDHYIQSGYLVKLSQEEISQTTKKTWYLPHFGVTNPKKPDKLRLVFDAAAVSHGVSLNSRLLSGPDILKPLPSVLCKFRERKVAISADIKEMFHQVLMRTEDQQSQRLLWRGMDRTRPPDEYKMTVMTFGASCSPFCAQLVKNENTVIHQAQFPRAVDSIVNRHYVDDFLDSCDSDEEAVKLFEEVFDIQTKGGFHLCNWISSDPKVISRIPSELRSKSQKTFGEKDVMNSERVLGLVWNPQDDHFSFDTNFYKVSKDVLNGVKSPTKREALSLVMSVFDPLGFTSTLTVKAKILLQKTWISGIGWDDCLPESLFEKWKIWIQELRGIHQFKIPRCYSDNFSRAGEIELHTFCDASELAFAAVSYFRLGTGETAFVAAKTRVTPIKTMTIPRYELQAAVMGTRLAESIRQWHSIAPTRHFFWTDSRIVKCWLSMDNGHLKQFVSHRVGEIQEFSDPGDWRWISTHQNVADEATRDVHPCDFSPSSRWLNGPEFLQLPHSQWPMDVDVNKAPADFDPETLEVRKEFLGLIGFVQEPTLVCLVDITRFSKWNILIRTTVRVIRASKRLLRKTAPPPDPPHLQARELEQAEILWWKWSQRQSYGEVIDALLDPNKERARKVLRQSALSKLSIFLDDNGVLRMKGRVQADVPIGNLVRNPVILDPKDPYTVLLIRHHHERAGHHGKDRVTNELKALYCISGLKEAVKRAWRNCQECKNSTAKPDPPEMAPLPKARLESYIRPFTQTGVDYFGPMEVTIGRRHEKRYGALFTCLVTRAVHLELAGSLSTDSFIMALRRFISTRGEPRDIYSDNGSNFVGANNELRAALKSMDQAKITDELASRYARPIQWHFNPPFSPHMGGSWERMVKSVKIALHATLKERSPREETLLTLLKEVENTVNGHPLTYVDADVEAPEVLTPNHFLIGTPNHTQPPGEFTDRDLSPGKQWRLAMRLSDHFWNRWIKEFLPTLTKRQKWIERKKPMEIGDVVLIVDSSLPRNSWPKGIIVEVSEAKDGQTRWAIVKTATGTYKRPAVKLCVLNVKPSAAAAE